MADTSRTGMYPVKCGSMWMNSASKFPSPSSMRLFLNPCLNCSQQFPSHFCCANHGYCCPSHGHPGIKLDTQTINQFSGKQCR